MIKRCVAICISLCFMSSAAIAGGYLGVGAGMARSNVTTQNKDEIGYGNTSTQDKDSGAYKIYGGYTAENNWGAEVAMYDFGSYRLSGVIGGTNSDDKFEGSAFAVSLVRNFSIGESFLIHTRLGGTNVETGYHCVSFCATRPDTSKKVLSPIVGLGFSWAATKSWGVRADWDYVTKAKSTYVGPFGGTIEKKINYSLFSTNLEYRF